MRGWIDLNIDTIILVPGARRSPVSGFNQATFTVIGTNQVVNTVGHFLISCIGT